MARGKRDDDKVKIGCQVERREAREIERRARSQERTMAHWIRSLIRAALAKEA